MNESRFLSVEKVDVTFDTPKGPLTVLEGASFDVARGEVVALIGHSGCGKSTLLNVIAGLHRASRGGVTLEGREVTEPGPDRAMVFQTHALLPWLTAYDNVRLAVDRVFGKTKTRAERHDWTMEHLDEVHMAHAADRKPGEISGGMRQRVGIARALAMQPKVLLMDEPFGALDALTRASLQDSLLEIQAALGMTVIIVTHDVDEAVLLSDKVVMLTNGPHAHVGEIVPVPLPRPRDRLALAEDPAFTHCRAELLRFLHSAHPAKAA
jgi:nitrate/nitrite transport system ATP-binding protein